MVHLDEYEPVTVPKIGLKYHVLWAHNGVVGVCIWVSDDNTKVMLMTPKTRIPFKNKVKTSELRHLKHRSWRMQHNRTTEAKENGEGCTFVPDCSKNLWKKIKPSS